MGAGLLPAEQQKAGGGFGGDQPSAMLALSSKGEYRGEISVILFIYGREEIKGVHAVYNAVFRLYVLL